MKEYSRVRGVCICIVFLPVCLFVLYGSESIAKGTFTIREDGSILAGAEKFPNMGEYVHSEYFREQGMRCGTAKAVAAVDRQTARSVNDCTLALTTIQHEYWLCDTVYTVQVWFHVIHRSDGLGNIPDAAIYGQVNVLNEDYRAMAGTRGSRGVDTRIRFELAGITRTLNDSWFNDLDNDGYTAALHRDTAKYVNVYTNTASGFLGYATYPQDTAGKINDGIVMNYGTIGGRDNGYQVYDQGRTLVHEMGHYLGLFHTFAGDSCSNTYDSGDLIVDTPGENTEHYECVQYNSCGTADPINNYMNYTPDACMTGFTREQANRSICSLANYRPALFQVIREEGGTCSGKVSLPAGWVTVPSFLTPLLFSR